nr:hypothetical protein [Plesiomonas shigelloides]
MAVAFLPVIGAIMRLVACKAWWPFDVLAEGSVYIRGRIFCAGRSADDFERYFNCDPSVAIPHDLM